ncbi:branched-chain amino acid ABC transporter permease [Inquilinus ginsengisoli]|uniref:branched-chain amino acid ABC transporter permease n=1 Tax=Inquilinus ginsengisoli TaxID=363840 RepID=UPI003D228DB5
MPPSSALRTVWPALLIFAVLALVPVVAPLLGGGSYPLTVAGRIMIFAIAAVSLDLILGYGGLVSFGHAAFIGLGAYAVGILADAGFEEGLLLLPAAMLAAAVFAALTGAVSLKTRGVHYIMITLAFGQMAYFTMTSLSAYGGDDGLTLWSRPLVAGFDWLNDRSAFYYIVLLLLVAAWALCRAVTRSRFGRVLRGCREDEERMRALGYSPFAYRLAATVIAGAIAGLAGALLAVQTEFVSPAYMSWQRSGELIVMVVLGGIGSLHGAIVGAAAFLLAEELLSGVTEHWRLIFGPLLILVVLFLRGGLGGLLGKVRHD